MTRIHRGLWLFAAASIVFAMGCGDNNSTDAGTGGCTTDAACGTGKVCHPILKACVSSCTGSTDCPAAEKKCAKFDDTAGTTASPGFCQCATDALCNNSVAGNICSSAIKQCAAKCTASSCPSGYTCNTTSGQCAGGGTDAGVMDAGTACNDIGICTYPEVCDFTASVCKPGATCNKLGVQPDTCGYAGYCTDNANCAQVPAPTCSNFGAGGLTPVFNPKTSTGPIIYYVETDPAPPAASCFKGFYVHSFFLNAYRDTDWPAQLTSLPGAWYVTSTGIKLDITAGLPTGYYVPTGKTMRLRKYLCAKASSSINAGFFFTGGNEICAASAGWVAASTSCTANADCGTGSTCTTATGVCN